MTMINKWDSSESYPVDFRQIEKLGPKPQQQITQLIDTFVEAEELKQKMSAV